MNRAATIAGTLLLAAAVAGWSLWAQATPASDAGSSTSSPSTSSSSTSSLVSTSPWRDGYLPNVDVISQDGKTYKFYDDLIKGKTAVINFIFTGCSQLCPLTTARLSEVQVALGEEFGRDVVFYSISLDPENDTPTALKKFASGYKIKPGWLFLTGNPDEMRAIREKLGERGRDKSEHQSLILLTNDKTGEWAKNSAMSETSHIVEIIREMDPAWRDRPRALPNQVSANETIPLSTVHGEGLFARACASCHTIGRGDKVGPDLAGAHQRRDRQWLTKFIMRPDKMREARDPIAVELFEKYNRVAMPYLGLTDVDAADLISYIETMSLPTKAADVQRTGAPDRPGSN